MSLFMTGPIVTTRGIRATMEMVPEFRTRVEECLCRHCAGDWGDVDPDSVEMNNDAVEAEKQGRYIDSLFSQYNVLGRDIFIITEIDRSVTTILFPEEY